MSAVIKPRYTLAEYFALELASDARYEYRDGHVFELSGATPEHDIIVNNLITGLQIQLRGRGCRVHGSNVRVKVPAFPPYRYPDLTALCRQPEYETIGGIKALTNPALIVEVLSPSTESFDRGDKFFYYKSIASFCEYLLVAQHRPHVTHYVRKEDGISWSYEEFNSLDDTLCLASLGISLKLSELYQDVDFAAAAPPLYPHEVL